MKFLIINGPNLNMLGIREPSVYGSETLPQLERLWKRVGARLGVDIETYQSNHEGAIIDTIQQARGAVDALILNAGAYSHTSYAIHDAIIAAEIRTVEVHISNIHERETWRHHSVITPVSDLVIVGRSSAGYIDAIRYLHAQLTVPPTRRTYADHADGFLDLRVPDGDGPHPVVVLVHGGYWRDIWLRDTTDQLAAALVGHGYATVNAEYRRGSGSFPAANDDIDAVIDWVRTSADSHGFDTENIILVGHSAGGYHVLHAAHRRSDVAGAVALAPVTDLLGASTRYEAEGGDDPVASFIGASSTDAPDAWEAASISGQPLVGVHVIHGSDDDVVDVAHSRSYIASTAADAGFTELDGVGHFELIDQNDDAFAAVLNAVNSMRRGS